MFAKVYDACQSASDSWWLYLIALFLREDFLGSDYDQFYEIYSLELVFIVCFFCYR